MTVFVSPTSVAPREGAGERVTFPPPGAGQSFGTVVPPGFAWRLHGASARLVTSATAANRVPNFVVEYDGMTIFDTSINVAQAASLDRRIVYYDQRWFYPIAFHNKYFPIGLRDLWLLGGSIIRLGVRDIQATDQLSAIMLMREEIAR
jgi:hypothetical protein